MDSQARRAIYIQSELEGLIPNWFVGARIQFVYNKTSNVAVNQWLITAATVAC